MVLILKVALYAVSIAIISGCDDIETSTCSHMIQLYGVDFCGDPCLSNLCKRSCGLCPTTCYQCHEIDDPKNCSTKVECPTADHNCFTTQSFSDDFREIYKLGCATKDLCKSYFGSGSKRSLRVEANCCSYDDCNNMTPEEIAFEKIKHKPIVHTVSGNATMQPLVNDCQDLNEADCQRIASINPNFCHDEPCAAEKLCPRMCKKCFRCNACNDIDRVQDCHTTVSCNGGKRCFTLETLSFDFRPVFRLGCMDQTVCSRFTATPSNTFGKRQQLQLKGGCCDYDICNDNRITTTMPTTTTTTTTTVPTTTTPSCNQNPKYNCPHDSNHYHNGCYFFGDRVLTWNASHAYCASRCGRMADFQSNNEMHNAVSRLQSKGLHNHLHSALLYNVWSDGILQSVVVGGSHVVTHWIWSHSQERISTYMDNNLNKHSSTTTPHECAYISDRTGRGDLELYSMDCSRELTPLCVILHN